MVVLGRAARVLTPFVGYAIGSILSSHRASWDEGPGEGMLVFLVSLDAAPEATWRSA